MSEPHRTPRVCALRLQGPLRDSDTGQLLTPEAMVDFLHRAESDAVLLEWSAEEDHRGLYAHLGAAARAQCALLVARWLPARSAVASGVPSDGCDGASLLAFARSDAALQGLFGEVHPVLDASGAPRSDEPVILLGVEGDVLFRDPSSSPTELRRRAETWIHRLGADRVVLAIPVDATEEHALVQLARQRSLPLLATACAGEARREVRGSMPPILWTDFQLDTEHRLPDDAWIPGLRDLLHRGSLLRERVLYERLPSVWRTRVDAELRALYSWHVSPLLRRVTTLVQTVDSVEGASVEAPLPGVRSATAYLLGLSDHRPSEAELTVIDPVESARVLASALPEMDRRLHAEVAPASWPRLMARLLPWAEGGHLALCEEPTARSEQRRFCFSGQPLAARAALHNGSDGLPRIDLSEADRLALGWFELELTRAASVAPREPIEAATVTEVLGWSQSEEQLALDFDESQREEKSA